MKVIAIFFFAMFVAVVAIRKRATKFVDHNVVEISEDPEQDYVNYLAHYYPTYDKNTDPKHHERLANFMKCRQAMIDHDPDAAGWSTGLTHFCHWTDEEMAGMKNRKIGMPAPQFEGLAHDYQMSRAGKRGWADAIDWRWWNGVSSVKNQGSCGSCYTFAAAAALEGQVARKSGKAPPDLSTQQYLDCSYGYSMGWRWNASSNQYDVGDTWSTTGGNAGCGGGWYHACYAMNNMTKTTQNGWSCYNYTGVQGKCSPKSCSVQVNVKGYVNVHNENELSDALNYVGPVACAFDASAISSYTGGVAPDNTCSKYSDHAITVIGYETRNGQNYWIIKNSWGPSWGISGYFYLPRGRNACGIASNYCAYPLINV